MAFQPHPTFQLNFQQGTPVFVGMPVILAPDYEPGFAPELAGRDIGVGPNFWAMAAIGNADSYVQDVDRWLAEVEAAGDEPVDVFASTVDDDFTFDGRRRQWGR